MNPRGSGFGVQVEVVQVIVDDGASGADGVAFGAVGAKIISVGSHILEHLGWTGRSAVVAGAVEEVVGLVGSVADITEEHSCSNCGDIRVSITPLSKLHNAKSLTHLARSRLWVESSVGSLRAAEDLTAASAQDITSNIGTLRETAKNQLRLGALLVVGGHLRQTVGGALLHSGAVVGVARVVELDVLVVAAAQAIADGVDQLALASGIGLVVAAGEEDVHVFAAILADADGAGLGAGCEEEGESE